MVIEMLTGGGLLAAGWLIGRFAPARPRHPKPPKPVRCLCLQYTGPTPLAIVYAPEVTG
jgi:hypothetical protein